jgi:hypothetical protein
MMWKLAWKAFWAWLKRWWKIVVGAVGGAVVIGVGAYIAVGAYKKKALTIKEALAVERAMRNVARLQGRREELLLRDAVDQVELERIDRQLDENRRQIEEVRQRADVSPEELVEELRALGY